MKLRNVIFYVSDIDRAKQFYEKLGFNIADDQHTFVSLKTDDENIFLSLNSNITEFNVPGKQVCAFYASDIEHLYAEMQKVAIPMFTSLQTFEWGRCFIVQDPDGNKLEFVEN